MKPYPADECDGDLDGEPIHLSRWGWVALLGALIFWAVTTWLLWLGVSSLL